MGDEQKAEVLGISEGAFHTVAGLAAVAGLCPLIPIPFVDDVIIDRIRRYTYERVSKVLDAPLADKDARYLTARSTVGLGRALKTIILWPLKKIIRKIAYVLSIKSCAEVAAAVFHEGWLFARAIEQGYVDRDALAAGHHDTVRDLRKALIFAHHAINPDVTRQAMRAAFGASRKVVAPLLDGMKGLFQAKNVEDVNLEAAEEEAAPLRARIEAELRQHWPLVDELDEALRRGYESLGIPVQQRLPLIPDRP